MTRRDIVGFALAIIVLAFALDMPGQPTAEKRIDVAIASCQADEFESRDCENQMRETN